MEPENKSLLKGSPFGNHHFQVPWEVSGCIYWPLRVPTQLGWHFTPFLLVFGSTFLVYAGGKFGLESPTVGSLLKLPKYRKICPTPPKANSKRPENRLFNAPSLETTQVVYIPYHSGRVQYIPGTLWWPGCPFWILPWFCGGNLSDRTEEDKTQQDCDARMKPFIFGSHIISLKSPKVNHDCGHIPNL